MILRCLILFYYSSLDDLVAFILEQVRLCRSTDLTSDFVSHQLLLFARSLGEPRRQHCRLFYLKVNGRNPKKKLVQPITDTDTLPGRHSRQRPPTRPWAQWGWRACSSQPPPMPPPPRTRGQGDLAGQAMLVRSTWNRARACRAVAGASFDGTLKKILKGLESRVSIFFQKVGFF